MHLASLGAAPSRSASPLSLLRLVDRPAREALDMARRPLVATLAPALLGLFLVATASALAGLVTPLGFQLVPRLDALRAIFEALVVVIPGTLVFAGYMRLRVSARLLLAATAIGLLSAGLVALCVLPLMAFLVLVSHQVPVVLALPSLLVPGLALGTLAGLPARVITSLDASPGAWWLSRAWALLLVAVFLVRVHGAVLHLYSQAW